MNLRYFAVALFGSWMITTANGESTALLEKQQAQQHAQSFLNFGINEDDFRTVRMIEDIEFARYGDDALLLDLYLPAETDEPVACVVTVSGGGFRARPKHAFARYAAFFATQGFAAACISYRGTPKHGYLETIADCKAAVRTLRANSKRLHLDPDCIGIFGQSAGGHLAAMVGVTGGNQSLEGGGGHPDVSSRVQAAVSFSGVFDFISRLRDGGHQRDKVELKKQTNGDWIGEAFSVESPRWKQASPINHLSSDDAPLLLVATKTDRVVPYQQSRQMHEAMQATGLVSELVVFNQGGHAITSARSINDEAWRRTIVFFREHLR